ncbi:MAG TPA: hypothetical protein VF516_21940, partial [Kofleriaceae bacterium]
RARGPDPGDAYDARDWKEEDEPLGTLVAKISPWLAMTNLVKNVGSEVPRASGGTTPWRFDCFEFVIVNRIYAYWRTMSRTEFNLKFNPLTLGYNADMAEKTHLSWEPPILASKPGDKPYRKGETKPTMKDGAVTYEIERIPVDKSWDELVRDAPIGTQIIWSNKDTVAKCTKDGTLPFCDYMNENVTKVGQDQYSAHPFGIVSAQRIIDEMATAPFGGDRKKVSKDYVRQNVYISALRYAKK